MKTQKPNLLYFYVITIFLISLNFYSQSNPEILNDSGNITIPSGVTSVTVQLWGGGGAAAPSGGSNRGSGGGGGGAYTIATIAVTPGQICPVVVGAGGMAGTQNQDAGASSILGVTANGGSGGNGMTGGNGGSASLVTGYVTDSYKGGNGGAAPTSSQGGGGGGGGSALTTDQGGNGNPGTTNGNSTSQGGIGTGNGGRGASRNGQNLAQTGGSPGGGGGGRGSGGGTAMSGAKGRVIVTYNYADIRVIGLDSSTIADGPNPPNEANGTMFPLTDINNATVSTTYKIENEGRSSLIISSITITGTHASDFTITQNAVSPVDGLSLTFFTITFNPSGSGSRTALVTINNNDPDSENPYTFTISGTGGTVPEIDVRGNSLSIADNSLNTTIANGSNLGSQHINGGTKSQVFSIHNLGSANLSISLPITITGANASDFTIVASTVTNPTLAPNSFTSFEILFNPSAAGTRTATVNIANNDSNENPYNFTIIGTGTLYLDSDGDGVTDDLDIDDDNDGILDSHEQTACMNAPNAGSAYMVFLNETFGSGTQPSTISNNASTTYNYISGTADVNDGMYSVRHTAQNTSWAPELWHKGKDHTGDLTGRMAIFNASIAPDEFYRTTIVGVTPNIPVRYSFWVLNLDRQDAPNIGTRIRPNVKVEFRRVSDNSLIIPAVSTGPIAPTINTTGAGSWQNFVADFTTAESSFKVIFSNNAAGGLGNDLALDDIVITQKYCDTDRDGYADVFDLDNDNDGIADIVEAGFKQYSANKSRMDLSNPSLWKDDNGNGMNDYIDPFMITGGMVTYLSMLKDSDADGVYDYMDLDSDNDSVFDIDEAQKDNFTSTYNGDADINGDGIADGVDTDKDGIMDAHDDLHGYGSTFAMYPVDSDNDGRPDYIDVTSDGSTFDIAKLNLYSNLDSDSDGILNSTIDADKDGIMDSMDGNTSVAGSPRNLTGRKYLIDFDGRNDYVQSVQLLSAKSRATIMAWIKLDVSFTNTGQIAGQDNMFIGVNSARQLFVTAGGQTATYSTALLANRWYHVTAVYNGGSSPKIALYLNGLGVTTSNSGSATSLAVSGAKFTIGKSATASSNYFRGYIDEVRVFDEALSQSQFTPMICQEIKRNGSAITGEFLPKDFTSVSWINLLAYYRMNNFKDDVVDDHKTDAIDAGTDTGYARAYNIKSIRPQTAPLPFITTGPGNIASNITNPANHIYGPAGEDFPGAIINVLHNTTISESHSSAGLLIDGGSIVTVSSDKKLENTWYLQLNGKIDLQGRSQLVQKENSSLAGNGILERDQQGTTNKYNYNYWSSPVSNSTINGGYTIQSVMKNGNNQSAPAELQWTDSMDAQTVGNNVFLSNNWIYKYQSDANGWEYMGPNSLFSAGQGYTLKGSAGSGSDQNYVFTGKPNNGTLTVSVASGSLSVVGNPYPSAINATEFIKDNLPMSDIAANTGSSGALNGNLYFWEHASSNNTHILANYQGSYAARNLVGYTIPVAVAGIGGTGGNTKYAREFIPVGQGFFVQAAGGGSITFKNSQRSFHKEDSEFSNTMFRNANVQEATNSSSDNDPFTPPQFPKLRLGFITPDGYHRQILLGFMGNMASDAIEMGFDAENFDSNPSDMTFLTEEKNLIIQGVGEFSENAEYKLYVKANVAAPLKFRLDEVEHFDPSQNVYIYDSELQQYHNITTEDFEIILDPGEYSNRFSLKFTDQQLDREEITDIQVPVLSYSGFNHTLAVRTRADALINNITLFNMQGQEIVDVKITDPGTEVSIQIGGVAAGTYIARISTTQGQFSRKVVIK